MNGQIRASKALYLGTQFNLADLISIRMHAVGVSVAVPNQQLSHVYCEEGA